MSSLLGARRIPWKRLLRVAALSLAGGGVLLAVGWQLYRHYQPEVLTMRGREFLNHRDYRNAALSAQRALQIDKEHLGASRVLADLTDEAGMADALGWRQRLADLQPRSVEAHVDLAKTALRLDNLSVAERALDAVRERGKGDAEFHSVSGTLAFKRRQIDEAKEHYHAALELEPNNATYRYNAAAMQLTSVDPAERMAALAILDQLRSEPKVRNFARRTIAADLVARGELGEALGMAEELQTDPESSFADKISYLDLLRRASSEKFETHLAMLRQSAKKPEEVGPLLRWQLEHGKLREALAWIGTLEKGALAGPRAGPVVAACYLETRDWHALEAMLKDAQWEGLEYLRHTYLARALRELGDENGFRAQWNLAVSAVGQKSDAAPLAQLATGWGWHDEVRDLLWAVARDGKDPQWALALLYQQYAEAKNSRGLLRVVARLLEINPSDEATRNNFAMYSLLLKADVPRAAEMARQLHENDKANAVFASTYAYALHVQDRTAEALQIMEALPTEKLEQPSIALYYGVLLAAGEPEKAAHFLTLAEKGNLFPEERELIEKSRHSQ